MRLPSFIRSLLLTAIILCASIPATSAENGSGGDAQQNARPKYDSISFAKGDFQISDPALVPRQLALAAEQGALRLQSRHQRVSRPLHQRANRRLALVFCRLGVLGSHYVFDFTDSRRPKLVELPFIAQNGGFGATPRPGLMIWKRDAGVFEAVPSRTYAPIRSSVTPIGWTRPGVWSAALQVSAVVRVEVREKPCGRNSTEWTTVWEASPWPASATVH